MEGLENIFFSPSSIGYLFGTMVAFVTSAHLYKKWKIYRIPANALFIKSLVFLGSSLFLFGLPAMFFSEDSYVLGLWSIPANIFLMFFHANVIRLALLLLNRPAWGVRFYYFLVLWTILVVVPINYIYLPLPVFDTYGLEIWGYSWELFSVLSVWTAISTSMLALAMLWHVRYSHKKMKTILIAMSFFIGGISSLFVVKSVTTAWLAFGYITMIMGAYWMFLLPFYV